jgi:peptide-methionine (R)-S-oxide reductase
MTDRIDKTDEEWRRELTPEEFEVARKGGTERAFTGRYWDCHEDGVYRCVCCGNELFSSEAKYDSGSGWPSFFAALDPARVRSIEDRSLGMRRIEIRCGRCDAHLGHLFDDGPKPTGLRYCVNSLSLDLDRKK